MQKRSPEQKKETLLSHAVPNKPCRKVGIDIYTHSSVNYLIIVDYFSDYFEFEKLSDMSSPAVIEICKRCFARLGIPETVHSDNGHRFSAREFATFTNEWDFQHTTCSPYHSQSNGKAYSSVKHDYSWYDNKTDTETVAWIHEVCHTADGLWSNR